MFLTLTNVPVMNPIKPIVKISKFFSIIHFEHSLPFVIVSITGGAMRARVELEMEPTKEMKRSSLGIAAARANVRRTRTNLNTYSALN